MNASAYELLASIARYWFLGLAVLIAVRLILAVVREMRIEWRVQREISEAGTSINATLVLLSDEDRRMRRGKLYARWRGRRRWAARTTATCASAARPSRARTASSTWRRTA